MRQWPPPFEKRVGDLAGAYSRRITIQHRLVYQLLEGEKTVMILRMWTHYEEAARLGQPMRLDGGDGSQ